MTRALIESRLAAGNVPCPFDGHMGLRFPVWEDGHVVVEADVDERFHNPAGVLHGGFMTSIMDTAMGNCMFSLIGPNDSCTNMDLNAKFLRPVTEGVLRAEATPIKQGRTISVVECRLMCDGVLVARAESTFMRFPAA